MLAAIADRPGISNRGVASATGVLDEGQISRLLARLRRLGLIASDPSERPRSSKAWRLTAAGGELLADAGLSPRAPDTGDADGP